MTKSEENKLDQLHDNLLDIENHAKNLNLNKNDNHRYILTDIVDVTESQKKEKLNNNDLKSCLNDIKNKLKEQQNLIDDLIKKISK
mgnify:CR=1 FL=1